MKIALIGYGKMGHMIEQIALDRGHKIVSIIDVNNQEDFDSKEFASADVAIEFTAPQAAYGNYLKAWAKGVKVVSGSTGWMKEHGDEVRKACADGKTLFWASNFSIGVAIFSAVNRYLAKIMNQFPQYDVEMEETHHVHKLDHPSGTAITLAEEIVENGGLLISEYRIGTPVNRYNLVARDRLQSGLSLATLVVQTGEHGGTMHAATATLQAGKPLYTMLFKNDATNQHEKCLGNALLVKQGAKFIKGDANFDEISNSIRNWKPIKTDLFDV